MIARQDLVSTNTQAWAKLAAPVPTEAISWRQDGRIIQRDGKYLARFVCYIEANTVRERLDAVVPGDWDLTLELLPPIKNSDDETETLCAFKARLQILGVIREDVGMGRDYKQASTDAFKRAAVRFGIGNELYAYEQNWVEMESDAKYAKPVEDPQHAYERRYGKAQRIPSARSSAPQLLTTTTLTDVDAVSCPKCGGRMWDNRLTKRNPKAPDYKCRDRSCDGVIWRHSDLQMEEQHDASSASQTNETEPTFATEDELPF